MLSSSHPKIHEPLVTGVSPRPHGPATAPETAKHEGCRRALRSRVALAGQAAGGHVSYDPGTERFSLTEEQAFALAAPDGTQIAAAFHIPIAAAKNTERITEAIQSNSGFAWHEHDPELFEGTERFFRPGYVANLVSSCIPALDGVEDKLRTARRWPTWVAGTAHRRCCSASPIRDRRSPDSTTTTRRSSRPASAPPTRALPPECPSSLRHLADKKRHAERLRQLAVDSHNTDNVLR